MLLLFESPLFCRVSEEQREKFTQRTEIVVHGVTFSIPNCAEFTVLTTSHVVWFPSVHVNRVEPSVSIVHFPPIKAVEEKNVCNSEETLSASLTVIFANRGNQRS